MQKRLPPLIEDRNYTVVCAAVRYPNLTKDQANLQARRIIEDWASIGYRRTAKIFYRDGSLVKEFGFSDL